MKRKYCLFLVLVLISAIIFTGCNSNNNDKVVLNVLNYGQYIDKTLLTEFEEKFNIEINYETYPAPEDMYTKVKAGGTNYDVIITSEYIIEKMINEGMLAKLNFDNIPNYQYVDQKFKNQPYDRNNEYAVPYFWGTVGILYNTKDVTESVDSWDLLWNEKYANKILMMDSQRDTFAVALKKLGYSLNTTNEQELQEAKQLLIDQKPLVMAYVVDEALDMMIAEEASIAIIWSSEAASAMRENENLNYIIPKEGSNIWIDSMCVPSTSSHKNEAESFINFITSKESTLKNIDELWYSTVHTEAIKEVDEFLFDNPAFNPPTEAVEKAEMFRNLKEYISVYNKLWTEVLSH